MVFFVKVIKILFQTIKKLNTLTITFEEKLRLFTHLKSLYPNPTYRKVLKKLSN
jgi:hypothetical protein